MNHKIKIITFACAVFFCLFILTDECKANYTEIHSQQEFSDVAGPFKASRYLVYKGSDENYHYFQEASKFGPAGPSGKYKISKDIFPIKTKEVNRVTTYNQNASQFEVGQQLKEIIKADFKEKYTYEEESFLKLKTEFDNLPDSTSNQSRSYKLMYLMEAAYNTKRQKEAEIYAKKLLEFAEKIENPSKSYSFGKFTHKANTMLGKIALDNSDIESAKFHLIESAKIKGSPALNSFGPNMSLAKKLLLRGEKQIVIEYLTICEDFWKKDVLEKWKKEILDNKIPDFGGNLVY